jgi:hypothetical protein
LRAAGRRRRRWRNWINGIGHAHVD